MRVAAYLPERTAGAFFCGTPLQITVRDVLRAIPYGKTVIYVDIANILAVKLQRRVSA